MKKKSKTFYPSGERYSPVAVVAVVVIIINDDQ
jgi:hypothetical protein